jgi:hypothetical protein
MAENLQQKQHAKTQVDRQLARLEEQVRNFRRISLAPPPPCPLAVAKGSLRGVHPRPQIYTLEAEYLDETANTGNVVVVRAPARPAVLRLFRGPDCFEALSFSRSVSSRDHQLRSHTTGLRELLEEAEPNDPGPAVTEAEIQGGGAAIFALVRHRAELDVVTRG